MTERKEHPPQEPLKKRVENALLELYDKKITPLGIPGATGQVFRIEGGLPQGTALEEQRGRWQSKNPEDTVPSVVKIMNDDLSPEMMEKFENEVIINRALERGEEATDTHYFNKCFYAPPILRDKIYERPTEYNNIIIMEEAPEETLGDSIKKGLDNNQKKGIAKQLGHAMTIAHRGKVAIKDMKIDDVRIDKKGDIRIIDQNLYEFLHNKEDEDRTSSLEHSRREIVEKILAMENIGNVKKASDIDPERNLNEIKRLPIGFKKLVLGVIFGNDDYKQYQKDENLQNALNQLYDKNSDINQGDEQQLNIDIEGSINYEDIESGATGRLRHLLDNLDITEYDNIFLNELPIGDKSVSKFIEIVKPLIQKSSNITSPKLASALPGLMGVFKLPPYDTKESLSHDMDFWENEKNAEIWSQRLRAITKKCIEKMLKIMEIAPDEEKYSNYKESAQKIREAFEEEFGEIDDSWLDFKKVEEEKSEQSQVGTNIAPKQKKEEIITSDDSEIIKKTIQEIKIQIANLDNNDSQKESLQLAFLHWQNQLNKTQTGDETGQATLDIAPTPKTGEVAQEQIKKIISEIKQGIRMDPENVDLHLALDQYEKQLKK